MLKALTDVKKHNQDKNNPRSKQFDKIQKLAGQALGFQ
jgi:hypothetical protein